jgi:hypothetical protein
VTASLYDFRDLDLMLRLAENLDASSNGHGVPSDELAQSIGLDDDVRAVSIRCSWMRRYGMLNFDAEHRGWSLTSGGERVVAAHRKAPALRGIEKLDDALMVDVMAHVTSRYQRGDPMLAQLLRREFLFGSQPR